MIFDDRVGPRTEVQNMYGQFGSISIDESFLTSLENPQAYSQLRWHLPPTISSADYQCFTEVSILIRFTLMSLFFGSEGVLFQWQRCKWNSCRNGNKSGIYKM